MKITIIRSLLVFSIFFFFPMWVKSQVVISTVTSWKKDVDETDLSIPNEAGADLNSSIETSVNFNQLDIRNIAETKGWKISVSRQDINWPGAFSIYVKRNSNGIPCGGCLGLDIGSSVSGYMLITAMEQDFIFGRGEVTDIDLQFMIDGISLVVDAESYTTEVVYTLYGD